MPRGDGGRTRGVRHLRRASRRHPPERVGDGWDLAALEKAGKIAIIEARLPGEEIVSGDFDIQGLLAIVGGHVKRIGARQIVMDALDVLLRIYDD